MPMSVGDYFINCIHIVFFLSKSTCIFLFYAMDGVSGIA